MSSLARVRLRIAAAGVAAVGFCVGVPSAAADNPICSANVCSFYSPSHKISCELDRQRGPDMPDTACTGETCLGNPGLGQGTLAYGQTAGIGPFTCRSEVSGITCTVASGRGFTISSSGITPAG